MALARVVLAWFGPLLVFGIDRLLQQQRPLVITALFDETAHIVTALLIHLGIGLPRTRSAMLGTLAGATLLDLDHAPQYLGWRVLARRTVRPVTHSLTTVLLIGLAAQFIPADLRWPVRCVAIGAATQLARDLGTGPVPLWWPVREREVQVPYGIYAGLLGLVAVVVGQPWKNRACTPRLTANPDARVK